MVINTIAQAIAISAASLQMTRKLFKMYKEKQHIEFNEELFQEAAAEAAKKLIKRYESYGSGHIKILNSIRLDKEKPELSLDEAIEILSYLYEDADLHETSHGKSLAWHHLSELFVSSEENAARSVFQEIASGIKNRDEIKNKIIENIDEIKKLQGRIEEISLKLKEFKKLYDGLLSERKDD